MSTIFHFTRNKFVKVQIAQNDIADGISFVFASILGWSHFFSFNIKKNQRSFSFRCSEPNAFQDLLDGRPCLTTFYSRKWKFTDILWPR